MGFHLSLLLILTTFLLTDTIAMPIAGLKVVKFLTRYGYLPEGVSRRWFLPYQNVLLEDAISDYQSFNGLEVTGELDEETVELMERPRCGVPDKPKKGLGRYAVNGYTWSNPNSLTFRITKQSSTITNAEAESIMKQAAAEWVKVANIQLTWRSWGKVDTEIRFEEQQNHGDDAFFRGTIAHTFPPGDYEDIAGDIHINEWTFDWRQKGRNYLLKNVIHEMGHSLGLSHSSSYGSIMAAVHSNTQYSGLSQDDINGITSLYGPKIYGR